MKKTLIYAAFSLIFMSTITSCKDKCKDVICQNFGTCADGTCTCPAWFEGTNCENEMRAKFYGNYLGSYIHDGNASSQIVKLKAFDGDVMKFWIDETVYAE